MLNVDDEEKGSYSLMQTFVKRRWFVSTVYRRSSVRIESPVPWFFETIVWEWDEKPRKTGRMIHTEDSGSFEEIALKSHAQICGNLALHGAAEVEEEK